MENTPANFSRPHGHALAKGLGVQELLDELFGAFSGCCKGKGGSMHVGNMEKGMVPGIAIVAGGIPLAAGMAMAFKMQQSTQVVACFFGDGAVAEGAFHDGVNMAAIWDLPVISLCEKGTKTGSVCAEIAAGIMERFGEYLRCPIRRVASADVPVPFTPPLENAYRPDVARIVEAALDLMQS